MERTCTLEDLSLPQQRMIMGFLRSYSAVMDNNSPENVKAHADLFNACIDNGLRDRLIEITDQLKKALKDK